MLAQAQNLTIRAHKLNDRHRNVRKVLCRALRAALSRDAMDPILFYSMSSSAPKACLRNAFTQSTKLK